MGTKNETTEDQLPDLEALDVTLEADTELFAVGKVVSIVGQIIVVKGTPDKSALSEESILFTASRQPLGRVWETFGRVREPHYTVRFAGPLPEGVEVDCEVFYAPEHADFILAADIHKAAAMKGSDASNMHDEEPRNDEMEFSDDEEEQAHKRKIKMGRKRPAADDDDAEAKLRGGKVKGAKGKGGKSGKGKGGKSKGSEHQASNWQPQMQQGMQQGGYNMAPPDVMANYGNYQMPMMGGHGHFQPMMGQGNYQMPMMGQGNYQMPTSGGSMYGQQQHGQQQQGQQQYGQQQQGQQQQQYYGQQQQQYYGQQQQQHQQHQQYQPPPPNAPPHPL